MEMLRIDKTALGKASTANSAAKKRVKGLPVTEEFMDLLHQVKQIGEIKALQHRTTVTWKDWVLYQWNEGFLKPLTIWVVWLFIGTMYFANVDFDGNYYKGFYFSISVGYCLGWGVLSPKYRYSKVFAIFYLFVGALFVLHYVTVLIQLAIAENENTYEQLKIKKSIARTCKLKGWQAKVYLFLAMNNEKLFVIYVWVLYVFIGAAVTVGEVGWSWLNGFYFSITTLATAGLFGIPHDSPDYLFLLTGLYTCTGVPTMAMAVSNIGMLIMEARAEARVQAIIDQEIQVTQDEVEDILKLKEHNSKIFRRNNKNKLKKKKDQDQSQVNSSSSATVSTLDTSSPVSPSSPVSAAAPDDDEIVIDRNEFLIVSLIRMKAIDIEQVHDLLTKFDRVDLDGDGQLSLKMVEKHRANSVASSAAAGTTPRLLTREVSKNGISVTASATPSGGGEVDGSVASGGVTKDGYQFLEDV